MQQKACTYEISRRLFMDACVPPVMPASCARQSTATNLKLQRGQKTRTCDNYLHSQFLTYIVAVQDASSDECKFAFDALVKPPKDSGYSTECIYSRAQLLKVAADCLVDGESRRHYNARLSTGSSEAQVLHGDMPGALALLQVCPQLGPMCSAMDLEKGGVLFPAFEASRLSIASSPVHTCKSAKSALACTRHQSLLLALPGTRPSLFSHAKFNQQAIYEERENMQRANKTHVLCRRQGIQTW